MRTFMVLLLMLSITEQAATKNQLQSLLMELAEETKHIDSPQWKQRAELDLLRLRARAGESIPCKKVRRLGGGPDVVRTILDLADTAMHNGTNKRTRELIDCAQTAVEDVKESNTISISRFEVACELAKLHHWPEADTAALHIPVNYWKGRALIEITRLKHQGGLQLDALTTLADALITADREEDLSLRAEALADIALLQAQMNFHDQSQSTFGAAIAVALQIPQRLPCVEALLKIAERQVAAHQPTDQASAFAQALRFFDEESDFATRSSIAGRISESFARLDDMQNAQRFLSLTASGFYYDVACQEVALAFARRQDFDKAQELLPKIEDVGFQEYLLRDISRMQAKAGNPEDAYRSIRKITREYIRAEAIREVMRLQVSAHLDDVSRAMKEAKTEDDHYVRFYGLVGIAEALLNGSPLTSGS